MSNESRLIISWYGAYTFPVKKSNLKEIELAVGHRTILERSEYKDSRLSKFWESRNALFLVTAECALSGLALLIGNLFLFRNWFETHLFMTASLSNRTNRRNDREYLYGRVSPFFRASLNILAVSIYYNYKKGRYFWKRIMVVKWWWSTEHPEEFFPVKIIWMSLAP